MVEIVKSIEKAYCSSCGVHLPDGLYNLVVSTKVSGGIKGTEINGLCKECLNNISLEIGKILEN